MKTQKIIELIDTYWKFDDYQKPMSSWHDKQDLLKILISELKADDKSEWCDFCGEKHSGFCSDHAKERLRVKAEAEVKCIYNPEWKCGADTNWCNSCDLKPKLIYNAGSADVNANVEKEVSDEEVCYFIERKRDNYWWSFDGFTNDPNKAEKFKSVQEAEFTLEIVMKARIGRRVISDLTDAFEITEHLFL